MTVDIDIANNGGNWPAEDALDDAFQRAISCVFEQLKLRVEKTELSVLLTSDSEVRGINAQWRNIDKATNVLSFPAIDVSIGDGPGPIMGDIIFAYETLVREAELEGKTFDDHLMHLFVHGVLHLLGYDHQDDREAERMERNEADILAKLGIKNPYLMESVGN